MSEEVKPNPQLQGQVLLGLTLADHCGFIPLDSKWFKHDMECNSGQREMKEVLEMGGVGAGGRFW